MTDYNLILPNRFNLEEYVCVLALAAATRSEDPFRSVGAALLDKHGNVLGTGTNGLAPGMKIPDWMLLEENRAAKSELMIHAEKNLWQRKKEGDEWLLGLTMSPCKSCAQLIVSSKVKKVVYLQKYDRGTDDYMKIFDFYGVEYYQLGQESIDKIKKVMFLCLTGL